MCSAFLGEKPRHSFEKTPHKNPVRDARARTLDNHPSVVVRKATQFTPSPVGASDQWSRTPWHVV